MTMPAVISPRPDDYGGHAVLLDWESEFLPWLRGKITHGQAAGLRLPLPAPWKPGHHWALIGPTGEGKSTFGVGILSGRKWVVSLDPKGEDETLESSGYVRVRDLPPPKDRLAWARKVPREGTDDWIWHRVQEGLPVGLIAGFEAMTDAEDAALHQLMRDAIIWARRTRGWTLYVDEFELLSSQRMFKLGPDIERMLITARRAGTSVVTSFQAAAWVSKHATRQAAYVTIWPTRDRQMIKNVAESMGRDWRMIAAAVDELPPFHCLTIPKQIRRPMLVTTAPKVSLCRTGHGVTSSCRNGASSRLPARATHGAAACRRLSGSRTRQRVSCSTFPSRPITRPPSGPSRRLATAASRSPAAAPRGRSRSPPSTCGRPSAPAHPPCAASGATPATRHWRCASPPRP